MGRPRGVNQAGASGPHGSMSGDHCHCRGNRGRRSQSGTGRRWSTPLRLHQPGQRPAEAASSDQRILASPSMVRRISGSVDPSRSSWSRKISKSVTASRTVIASWSIKSWHPPGGRPTGSRSQTPGERGAHSSRFATALENSSWGTGKFSPRATNSPSMASITSSALR